MGPHLMPPKTFLYTHSKRWYPLVFHFSLDKPFLPYKRLSRACGEVLFLTSVYLPAFPSHSNPVPQHTRPRACERLSPAQAGSQQARATAPGALGPSVSQLYRSPSRRVSAATRRIDDPPKWRLEKRGVYYKPKSKKSHGGGRGGARGSLVLSLEQWP